MVKQWVLGSVLAGHFHAPGLGTNQGISNVPLVVGTSIRYQYQGTSLLLLEQVAVHSHSM